MCRVYTCVFPIYTAVCRVKKGIFISRAISERSDTRNPIVDRGIYMAGYAGKGGCEEEDTRMVWRARVWKKDQEKSELYCDTGSFFVYTRGLRRWADLRLFYSLTFCGYIVLGFRGFYFLPSDYSGMFRVIYTRAFHWASEFYTLDVEYFFFAFFFNHGKKISLAIIFETIAQLFSNFFTTCFYRSSDHGRWNTARARGKCNTRVIICSL